MTFAVGIFDLFTYTISGSIYLTFFAYLAVRLHWLDFGALSVAPIPVLVVAVVLSYLLGFLAYPIGARVDEAVPRKLVRNARQEFLRRVPAAKDRAYVQENQHLLLSALQLRDKDVAADVTRLRATGLMLRNAAAPLALGAVAAIVELFLGGNPVLLAGGAVLLMAASFSLVMQGRRFLYWAHLKTLELCFWLPEIDDQCSAA